MPHDSPQDPRRPRSENAEPQNSVDLHGMRPEEAQRTLERELHAARVRRLSSLLIITGRGWGNDRNQPVLRDRTAAWLRGPEGRSRGVKDVTVTSKGGALLVRLG